MSVFPIVPALAQQEIDYTLHAKFLYVFTKYIEWPEEKRTGSFVIGLAGNDEIYKILSKIAETKKIKGQKLVVLKLKNTDDPSNCHMVFVSRSKNAALTSFALKISNKPVLVISEKSGSLKSGSDINFVIKDNNLNFELNSTGTKGKKLILSNELINLALKNE